jgi:hypothetical protein
MTTLANGLNAVVLLSGGFHNRPEIWIRVNKKYLIKYDESYLTEHHIKRLEKHFCGIKGCNCGSYHKATKKIHYGKKWK